MGNLQVKDVPEEIHDELRRRAVEAGMTVRDYVLKLIRRDQAGPSPLEWAASLRSLRGIELRERPSELVRRERESRERRGRRR